MSAVCDLCATRLDARAVTVLPAEMRIIAGNGYGAHVPVWTALTPEARRSKLYQLALINDTPWALCRTCYEATRS